MSELSKSIVRYFTHQPNQRSGRTLLLFSGIFMKALNHNTTRHNTRASHCFFSRWGRFFFYERRRRREEKRRKLALFMKRIINFQQMIRCKENAKDVRMQMKFMIATKMLHSCCRVHQGFIFNALQLAYMDLWLSLTVQCTPALLQGSNGSFLCIYRWRMSLSSFPTWICRLHLPANM